MRLLPCRGCPASCCRTSGSPARSAPRAGARASLSASRNNRFRRATACVAEGVRLHSAQASNGTSHLISHDRAISNGYGSIGMSCRLYIYKKPSAWLYLQVACSLLEDEPIFQPSPLEIRFQGYAACHTYVAQLCLRNNDKVCIVHSTSAITTDAAQYCLHSYSCGATPCFLPHET